MNCPYCGKEMQEGKIPTDRMALRWFEAEDDIAYAKGMPLTAPPIIRTQYAAASYCSDCRILIVPVPDEEAVEGPMTKLGKKIEAWEERRGQEYEQRQAEKEAEKKQQLQQKKQEKRRKKDPWEV